MGLAPQERMSGQAYTQVSREIPRKFRIGLQEVLSRNRTDLLKLLQTLETGRVPASSGHHVGDPAPQSLTRAIVPSGSSDYARHHGPVPSGDGTEEPYHTREGFRHGSLSGGHEATREER